MSETMSFTAPRRRRYESSGPLSGNEVFRLANELIASLGVRATSYANWQALQARENGDSFRMTAWRWIAGATDEILRSDPSEEAHPVSGD